MGLRTLWEPRPKTNDTLELAKWSYRTLIKSTEDLIERAKRTKKEDVVFYETKNGPQSDRPTVEDVPSLQRRMQRQKEMINCLNERGLKCFEAVRQK